MILVVIQVVTGIPLALFTILLHKDRKRAWAWYSGAVMDGQKHTNATWFMRSHGAKPVLHHTGHAIWWHHLPRIHRAGGRTSGTLAAYAAYAGLILAPLLTGLALTLLASGGLGYLIWRIVRWLANWKHWRAWGRPTHRALAKKMGAPPAKLEIARDRSTVVVGLPEEYVPSDRDKEEIVRAVTTKLALQSPAVDWSQLHGQKPQVVFSPCPAPPPSYVPWEGAFAAAVQRAAANELVFGLGIRNAVSTAKYSQSPHLMIPGDSGGGKSNLAAVLLLQEMMRGSLIFNLDPKWISHLWLQGLPNVVNAHDPEDLHLALVWLGKELDRRTKAAYRSAGGTGRVRGKVGDRIVILCEELNYGMPGLKELWLTMRAGDKSLPKQSPAISAMAALACAGRASDMHEWLIAQLMTVESTGVKDSTIRTNAGIKAMARWATPGWNMAVGKHIPMPPQTTIPGRIQLVTGDGVEPAQVPYLHLDDDDPAAAAEVEKAVKWARALAVSGTVAKIPIGGEYGVPLKLVPACVLGEPQTERLAICAGQGPGSPRSNELPGGACVVATGVRRGHPADRGAADPPGRGPKGRPAPRFPRDRGLGLGREDGPLLPRRTSGMATRKGQDTREAAGEASVMRVRHSASICATMRSMDAMRNEKISVNLTPDLAARLDRYAASNHWSRSTAAAVLIERGLPVDDAE